MATVPDQLPEQAPAARIPTVSWLPILWFTALLVVAYLPVLNLRRQGFVGV